MNESLPTVCKLKKCDYCTAPIGSTTYVIKPTDKHPYLSACSESCLKLSIERYSEQEKIAHKPSIDHPAHYQSKGIEAIDVIDAFDLDFCLGNAIKYILRAGRKDKETKLQDIEKAMWYLKWYLQKLEENNEHQ